jgi:hypothetical protein
MIVLRSKLAAPRLYRLQRIERRSLKTVPSIPEKTVVVFLDPAMRKICR